MSNQQTIILSTHPVSSPKSLEAYAIGLSATVGLVMQKDRTAVSAWPEVTYSWHSLLAIMSAATATTCKGSWWSHSWRILEEISLVTTVLSMARILSLPVRNSLNELVSRSNSIFFLTRVFLATKRLHSLQRKGERKRDKKGEKETGEWTGERKRKEKGRKKKTFGEREGEKGT